MYFFKSFPLNRPTLLEMLGFQFRALKIKSGNDPGSLLEQAGFSLKFQLRAFEIQARVQHLRFLVQLSGFQSHPRRDCFRAQGLKLPSGLRQPLVQAWIAKLNQQITSTNLRPRLNQHPLGATLDAGRNPADFLWRQHAGAAHFDRKIAPLNRTEQQGIGIGTIGGRSTCSGQPIETQDQTQDHRRQPVAF